MKYILPLALLLAATTAAQATLTPFDGTRERNAPIANVTDSGAVRASPERPIFQAPRAGDAQEPGRCSVSTFVFTKIRLAQACY